MATSSNPTCILDVGCGTLEFALIAKGWILHRMNCKPHQFMDRWNIQRATVHRRIKWTLARGSTIQTRISPLPTAATVFHAKCRAKSTDCLRKTELSSLAMGGCALVPADLLHQLQSEVCKQVDSKIATCRFLRAFQASILDFDVDCRFYKAKRSSCDWKIALLYSILSRSSVHVFL